MILKQKAIFEHLQQRHKAEIPPSQNTQSHEEQIDFTLPPAKRFKVEEKNGFNENNKNTNEKSSYLMMDTFRDEQIFTFEYENAARYYQMHQNYYIQEFSGLKMKLRRCGDFSGGVVCS